MKKLFVVLFAVFAVFTTTIGSAGELNVTEVMENLHKTKAAEAVYVTEFYASFVQGFYLSSGRLPNEKQLEKVLDIITDVTFDGLVPALKKDGIYEDWVQLQLDKEHLTYTEKILRAESLKELAARTNEMIAFTRARYPRLMSAMDKNPVYPGLIVQLTQKCCLVFAEEK